MKQQGLLYFTEIPMMVVGMCLFLIVFAGVVARTFTGRKRQELLNEIAKMPLQDEGVVK